MNRPNPLPRELLTLILVEVSDDILEKIQNINPSLRFLTANDNFWKARYWCAFADTTASRVLPETVAYYGWKELYNLVARFDMPEGQSYVGPIGNVYLYSKKYKEVLLLITLPIREVVLLASPDDATLVVVYLNFDLCLNYSIFHSFEYNTSPEVSEGVEVKFRHNRGNIFGPSIRYHLDPHMLVLLAQDGQVFFCYKPADLVNVKNNIHGQVMFGDISVALVPNTKSSYFTVTSTVPNIPLLRELDINIFSVTYNRNAAQVFRWPRVSAEYFAKLQEEMDRLLE